ncbi:MAG: ATP-binding protein, partial [Desulfitobacteriaceae bacterium]|nr:ATP-binding protein [Desulfitobacteriaceae bacterium]
MDQGYKVSFIQMDTLINLFKTQEISRSSKA